MAFVGHGPYGLLEVLQHLVEPTDKILAHSASHGHDFLPLLFVAKAVDMAFPRLFTHIVIGSDIFKRRSRYFFFLILILLLILKRTSTDFQ